MVIMCRRVVRPWLGLKMIDLNEMIIAQLKERDATFPNVNKGVLVPMVCLLIVSSLNLIVCTKRYICIYVKYIQDHNNLFFLSDACIINFFSRLQTYFFIFLS